MLKLSDTPILWNSKQQGIVAPSNCASEYAALLDSTQHLVQAIGQLTQLARKFDKAIFCDNQAVVQVLINNHSRKPMWYLNHAFFFNNAIQKHKLKVNLVPTADMQADMLTKCLSRPSLQWAIPFLCVMG
ncbi:hypothetical protein O181_103284 [Austropuccinia psidii MF-1]|uniref:Uncharacterized protein n=1 Tax=Austropuccinia psidii MF-1 TaxID=1389203 RepID=A0A9Q3PJ28_9BASI|nr:hypothetical protein [Austropuccinia psidii MF-1]